MRPKVSCNLLSLHHDKRPPQETLSSPPLKHNAGILRPSHLRRDLKLRILHHLQQPVPSLFCLVVSSCRSQSIAPQQARNNGDEFHLAEFLSGTDTRTYAPRDIDGAFRWVGQAFEAGRSISCDPSLRFPDESVGTPVFGVGLKRIDVDGKDGIGRYQETSVAEKEALRLVGHISLEVRDYTVESEGFVLGETLA